MEQLTMQFALPHIEPLLGAIDFRGKLSWWIAGPLIAFAVITVFIVYFREALKLHPLQRIVMATLRGLALACIILLLLKPVLVKPAETRSRKLPIVVLVDASQSMTQHDPRTSVEDR